MKIILAGYNLDQQVIEELGQNALGSENRTPETIAAAYARISRSPQPVDELRATSRREVEKARRSNRMIVFEMGHSSIAEHAVFNIDILGVSRLLVEEIERFRLASYTEKSQRYVLLQDDFVIPEEIKGTGLEGPFVETIRLQNQLYHLLYDALLPYVLEKNRGLAEDTSNRSMLEGWAKEDARYTLALATETQLGMTINARNLERMIRRFAAHPLAEAKRFGQHLYNVTVEVAPSLIRYTGSTDYDRYAYSGLKASVATVIANHPAADMEAEWVPPGWRIRRDNREDSSGGPLVRLVNTTPDADDYVTACLIHTSSSLPMEQCLTLAVRLDDAQRGSLFRAALAHMQSYDAAPREFEHAELSFDIVLSASAFAQMKRHRIATITAQDYDPSLGITIPPSIKAVGMEGALRTLIMKTEETFREIYREAPAVAPYILTNAHRKRILMKVNAREMYHIARLRSDRHAQWDIRQIADAMLALGRQAMPFTMMLATGKDGFADLYGRVMKQPNNGAKEKEYV
jgi:flavin-dependent thymidylate synthase